MQRRGGLCWAQRRAAGSLHGLGQDEPLFGQRVLSGDGGRFPHDTAQRKTLLGKKELNVFPA